MAGPLEGVPPQQIGSGSMPGITDHDGGAIVKANLLGFGASEDVWSVTASSS